jgi:hypothetical protein
MAPAAHTSVCWPNERDYLDGRKEIRLASERLLRLYWDTDIRDVQGVRPAKIIDVRNYFDVRFRLELAGDLWACIAGDWEFDVGFTPIGKGKGFDLSDHMPAGTMEVRNWKGCERTCIELTVRVPPNTIPAEYRDGTLYEVGGKFQLHCCGKPAAVVGYEPLEEYQFYHAEP